MLARLMDLAQLTSENLLRVTPSFQFRVITADPDDNIFTDCAITAHADYLFAEDAHFVPLAEAGYKPRPPVAAAVYRPIRPQRQEVQVIASGIS
jgi:hypothetical protein